MSTVKNRSGRTGRHMTPKQVRKLWVKALRSGEYKQTTGALRKGDGFCCLGVLCNLHAQAHPEIAAKETDPSLYMGVQTYLPDAVQDWAGIARFDPIVSVEQGNVCISSLNDGHTLRRIRRHTFAEIADVIEAQLV